MNANCNKHGHIQFQYIVFGDLKVIFMVTLAGFHSPRCERIHFEWLEISGRNFFVRERERQRMGEREKRKNGKESNNKKARNC